MILVYPTKRNVSDKERTIDSSCAFEMKSYTNQSVFNNILFCVLSLNRVILLNFNEQNTSYTKDPSRGLIELPQRESFCTNMDETLTSTLVTYVHCILLRSQLKFILLYIEICYALQFKYRARNMYNKWLYDISNRYTLMI